MPDRRRARCVQCRRHRNVVGLITWSGLCIECAKLNVGENIEGIMLREGPAYKRWRGGVIRYAEGLLAERTLDVPRGGV